MYMWKQIYNKPEGAYFCWLDFCLFMHILLKTEYRIKEGGKPETLEEP